MMNGTRILGYCRIRTQKTRGWRVWKRDLLFIIIYYLSDN